MKSKHKLLKLIALFLPLLYLFFCCENPYKTTPCFFVEIESECHEESTRTHYEVSSKEFQRITSYLKSNDPNYYSSEECMHITFKTKEGADVSGYFVSVSLCD